MEVSSVYKGRPDDVRSDVEERVYRLLDEVGIGFDRIDHDNAETMEDCDVIGRVLGARICKNLFLCNSQKTDFYLLMMPADKPFKTKLLSPQLGCSRLSFAPPEIMQGLIRCTPGSASLAGLVFDTEKRVTLVIDRELKDEEKIGLHPCKNTSSLALSSADIFGKLIPALGHEPHFVDLTLTE